MIDLFDLYQSFQSVVNTFVGGWWRPQTDFTNAANDFSNEIWEIETRRAEKSQEARDNLFPFLKTTQLIVKKNKTYYSTVTPPKDYGRFASARYILSPDGECDFNVEQDKLNSDYYSNISEQTVELIDEQRWGSCLTHLTKKPSMKNPKMNQNDGVFKVAPRDISVLVLSYYVRPTSATFIYTPTPINNQTGAGGQIIYDKLKSTPLQWPSTMINEFLWKLGERYGMFTRDQFITAITNKNKEK